MAWGDAAGEARDADGDQHAGERHAGQPGGARRRGHAVDEHGQHVGHHRVGDVHARDRGGERPGRERRLAGGHAAQHRGDQRVEVPAAEQRGRAGVDEQAGRALQQHRGQGEAEPGGDPEQPGPRGQPSAQRGRGGEERRRRGDEHHDHGEQPAVVEPLVHRRPAVHDQQDGEPRAHRARRAPGAGRHPPARPAGAEGQGEQQLGDDQRLHDRHRAQVQCRGLDDEPADVGSPAGQPPRVPDQREQQADARDRPGERGRARPVLPRRGVLLQDGRAGEQEGGDEAERDDDQHSWGLAPAADAAPSAPRMAVTIGGKRRPRSSFGRPGREGQRAGCRTRSGARRHLTAPASSTGCRRRIEARPERTAQARLRNARRKRARLAGRSAIRRSRYGYQSGPYGR